jgi:hypothetical protein
VDRIEVVAGLDPALVERVIARVRDLEPATVAVLVTGSYAKGTADERSDLDLSVATDGDPVAPYRMWFEERPGASPLHVSPSVASLETRLARREEPQRWALGFPGRFEMQYVWATEEARAALGEDPSTVHPPADPELEDFVEYLAKLRRASDDGDGVLVRLHARLAAEVSPGLLRPLNEVVVVRDRPEALAAAFSTAVAPEHYRTDLTIALGLADATDDEVVEAGLRLGGELLAFLRERKPDADPQPDIAGYLADGTLERHLGFL